MSKDFKNGTRVDAWKTGAVQEGSVVDREDGFGANGGCRESAGLYSGRKEFAVMPDTD